ncbi:coiled-coil domain-containing protein 73 isoform X2 [Pseudophryne corroboree]|uniref:coiled-coil domain-containing protein 73 isoform X2 n=1 Tax=Pseudophryne corroboree TaxID=495146 RepID=UPI003082045A
MDKEEMEIENTSYPLNVPSETLLPIQLFEFRTHLLEAVEELRMGRLAKVQYEEQISKILMEKQELVWKNESLSSQEEILEKRHKDALAVLKKQLQSKMCTVEEEKGRFQLAAETKEREIFGLKEDIKALQEQKLQLYILAKEDHIKQLSDCEKCFGNVTQQFGMIKEVHEKLEQNVKAAMQNNKKMKMEIKRKNDEIDHLKEELNKLSSDFMNYKVTYQQRVVEEKFSLSEKEQQLEELKERLQMETEINKRLTEVNLTMKEEKQEGMRTMSNMLTVVQRHNQTTISLENQLSAVKEDYKTLERDNELQRAKATENEEKFLMLQGEHETALRTWKKQEETFAIQYDTIKKELQAIKKEYEHLQECNSTSLNNEPQTMTQAQEQERAANMFIKDRDAEHSTPANKIQSDPVDNTTSSENADSAPMNSNEILKRNESNLEYVCKDTNSLPNVYNIIDKVHLTEEPQNECGHTKNKDNLATVKQSVEECCAGEHIAEIPADRACMNDVAECNDRAAECSNSMQTQVIVESVKMLLDNNKPLTVCREDVRQQTDSSHRKSGDGTSEVLYTVIDKVDTTENGKGIIVNEIPAQESQMFPETTEQFIVGQSADREDSPAGISCTLGGGSRFHSSVSNWSTSDLRTISLLTDQNKETKTDPLQPTKESPGGVCAESTLCKQIGKDDHKSFVFEEPKMLSFDNTQIEEKESKGLAQERNASTSSVLLQSSSCQVPMKNVSSESVLDPEDHTLHSLQPTENTDALKSNNLLIDLEECCPPMSEKNAAMVKSRTSDINMKKELQSDKHTVDDDQATEQVGDPVYVVRENAFIQDESNMTSSCTGQEDSIKPHVETSCTTAAILPEKKPKMQNEGTANTCSNLAKTFTLPRTNPWNSSAIHISCSKQSNCTSPVVSSQEIGAKAAHGSTIKRRIFDTLSTNVYPVPRKDHSAEWNAIEQIFNNSSVPTEHSDTMEKVNSCPAATNFPSLPDVTNLQSKPQPEIPQDCTVSSIQCQINAIEKFLMGHRLNMPKKRKVEDGVQVEEA